MASKGQKERPIKALPLDGSNWQTEDDFYDAFFAAVEAPPRHGRNLDALSDSISTGNINTIGLPYSIRISAISSMSGEARSIVERFRCLIQDLEADGDPVAIELSE